MNYIINPAWFYWMQLASGMKVVAGVFLGLSCVLFLGLFIVLLTNMDFCDYEDDDVKRYMKWTKRCAMLCIVLAVITAAIPSKDTLIEMRIAKYATVENANWTLETIKSAVDYIVESIKSMK